jgi:hypothetical protein
VPSHHRKQRINLTVDPDIYREAVRRFKIMDSSISAFLEQNLALFIQMTEPLVPLIEQAESGEVDPAQMKSAMRSFLMHSTAVVGGQVQEFGQLLAEANQEWGDSTDKK